MVRVHFTKHFNHERLKVDAAAILQETFCALKEQVHTQGFSDADAAVQIDAARGGGRFGPLVEALCVVVLVFKVLWSRAWDPSLWGDLSKRRTLWVWVHSQRPRAAAMPRRNGLLS